MSGASFTRVHPPAKIIFPRDNYYNVSSPLPSSIHPEVGKVTVVGILGSESSRNASLLHSITGIPVFSSYIPISIPNLETVDTTIEMFHDINKNTIFLRLRSSLDRNVLANRLEQFLNQQENHSTTSSGPWVAQAEFQSAKAILFLCLVCHSIYLIHPTTKINRYNFQVLRTLKTCKDRVWTNLINYKKEALSSLPWASFISSSKKKDHVPSIHFLFQCESIPEVTKGKKGNSSLTTSLEGTIKALARSFKLTPNESLVKLEGSIVYLFTSDETSPYGIAQPLLHFQRPKSLLDNISQPYTSSKTSNSNVAGFIQRTKSKTSVHVTEWYADTMVTGDFLLFSMDSLRSCKPLLSYFTINENFSRQICDSLLATVRQLYFGDLPPYYTSIEHIERIRNALRRFYTNARGPLVEQVKEQLVSEFHAAWTHERHRCEARSLTGHTCKYPLHAVPGEVIEDGLECMKHCSDFVSISSCNCGKGRKERTDPFTLEEANCTSFLSNCCHSFKSVDLPKQGKSFSSWSLLELGDASQYDPARGLSLDGLKMNSKKLIPFVVEPKAPLPSSKAKEEFPSLGSNVATSRKHQKVRKGLRSPSPLGWIGYEYECPLGHRFIESIHSITNYAKEPTVADGKPLNITVAFKTIIPMYTSCRSGNKHFIATTPAISQLQRIYIATPPKLALRIKPKVTIVSTNPVQKNSFSMGKVIEIPANKFISLRIPLVYEKDGSPFTPKMMSQPRCSFQLVS